MSQFLIYKSSAGSGKTTALIGIFLKLALSSPKPGAFKRILAITFTNKAANEMKERLIKELEKFSKLPTGYSGGDFMADQMLKDTHLDADELRARAWRTFQLLLHDYGDLAISTIDTFNQRLIRAFSRELDLKADYDVELDQKALFHDAVVRLVAGLGQDAHLTRHIVGYVSQMMDDDQKVDIIKQLEDLEHLILKENALSAVASLQDVQKEDFAELAVRLKAEAAPYVEQVRRHGRESLEWMDEVGISANDLAKKSGSWPGYFSKMQKFDGKAAVKMTATQENLLGMPWVHPNVKTADRPRIEALIPSLEKRVYDAIAINTEGFKKYILAKSVLRQLHLVAVIGDLFSSLETLREERNILPISYFNRIVSEALREEPVAFLYENFGSRYDHILIDEFQDTSSLQWHNLLPLVEETLARGKQSLVVGDAKQSIYRWRGGKAEQLIALPEIAGTDPTIQASISRNARIERLNTNYRSLPVLVSFNNALTSALGSILAEKDTPFALEYGAEQVLQSVPEGKAGGYAEIQYLGKKAKKDAHWECLLNQINRALGTKIPLGDMAILVRAASDGREIAAFLQEHGIAVVTNDSYEIDRHPEVKCVLSLMRLIPNPNLVPAKLGAMRALCTINAWEFEPHRYSRDKNIDLNAFLQNHGLPQLRQSNQLTGAYQVCENLARDYIPHLRERNSFIALINSILRFGGTGGTTSDFLTWWDSLKDKPSAAQNASQNAIQLLTIHKSKGLQFKVCFLPFVNWRMEKPNEVIWAPLSDTNLLPLKFAPFKLDALEKCGFADLRRSETGANRFDNLNLIYVALTRAEEQLYVCFTQSIAQYIGGSFFNACQMAAAKLSEHPHYSLESFDENGIVTKNEMTGDKAFTLSIGVPTASKRRKKDVESGAEYPEKMMSSPNSPDEMWFDRFELAYGEDLAQDDISRKTGVLFHKLVAETKSLNQAEKRLSQWLVEGLIELTEETTLSKMVRDLFRSELYIEAISSAICYSERELVHEGELLRPDLVAEHPDRTVVIDFKTGEANEEKHRTQVEAYMDAVRSASGKPTEGYVVYLSPQRWVQVHPKSSSSTQGRLFD